MLLEAYYEQYKDALIGSLTRLTGDREAALDAVQESFVAALSRRAVLSAMEERALWSWFHTTARNKLIDGKRKTARNDLRDVWDEADPAGDLSDALIIQDLLQKLPPNLMHIVSLRYYGGLNATQIGEMKCIPASTVRSQLRAALSILKKHASI